MRFVTVVIGALALAGCSTTETSRRAGTEISLPPMSTFSETKPRPPVASNGQIARDFLDLAFTLENGQSLPRLTRFEGPITVQVNGAAPPSLGPDLARLLSRLRTEAGIPISMAAPGAAASITINPIPKKQLQTAAPGAACFVRPGVSNWDDYQSNRNDASAKWTALTRRTQMAVFLPNDVSPQEVRDCLHEEISQALGPVNDLYRLPESIFNDDNFHTVLTGYDMVILRTFYHPALRSGMRKSDVAALLPRLLAEVNPAGQTGRAGISGGASGGWDAQIAIAMTGSASKQRRRAAAERAIALSSRFGPGDTRFAFSHYLFARLSLATAPDRALASFLQAGRIYESRPDTGIQAAHVAMQIAAFQLSAGRARNVITLVDQHLPAVREAEHASLLSLLLLVKAEALEIEGRTAEAARIQKQALSWGRYGFGSSAEMSDRVAEIAAISPRTRERADT